MSNPVAQKVLVLGADGFIGRHIAFYLRDAGYEVIASARKTRALEQMGFATLRADLCDPASHTPEFWRAPLANGTWLVNCAGLLTSSEAAFEAVHVTAPKAAYAALTPEARAVLISAIGIEANTPFGRWRRQGEAVTTEQVTILRPGLVMADTSYGGTSLERALSALPLVLPVIGDGEQRFNPIHASDLAAQVAACLQTPPPTGPHETGGPDVLTLTEMLSLRRRWLGLSPARSLKLSLPVARLMGRIGDALRFAPISLAAVEQLQHGVLSQPAALPGPKPRGIQKFLFARPAGTQDLWQARLYLMRPLLRMVLAMMWVASGLLGLFLPPETYLPFIPDSPIPESALIIAARASGLLDLAIALALLRGWRLSLMGYMQLAIVGAYTAGFSLLAPHLWLLPLGGLLKNLPILALIAVWMILEKER